MVKIVKTRRVHCKIRYIDAITINWSNDHTSVRCVFRKHCNECPFESSV